MPEQFKPCRILFAISIILLPTAIVLSISLIGHCQSKTSLGSGRYKNNINTINTTNTINNTNITNTTNTTNTITLEYKPMRKISCRLTPFPVQQQQSKRGLPTTLQKKAIGGVTVIGKRVGQLEALQSDSWDVNIKFKQAYGLENVRIKDINMTLDDPVDYVDES